jgi:hypothetical protein
VLLKVAISTAERATRYKRSDAAILAAVTENLGGICFGMGSGLFFYLFFKSRYIPRFLSALGVCASVIWTGLYLANLVFPEQHALFQYICFPPMALADIAIGFYLVLFAVKSEVSGSQPAQLSTIALGD